MDIVTQIIQFIEFLFVMVLVLAATLVVLLIAISLLPKDNPLRHLMVALAKPVGVMVGVGIVAAPIEFIPVVDVLYDFGSLAFIVYSWIKFAGELRVVLPEFGAYFSNRNPARGTALSAQDCFRRGLKAKAKQEWGELLHWMRLAAQRGHAEARAYVDDIDERVRRDRENQDAEDARPAGGAAGAMTRAEALEILDLDEGATRDLIMGAYKRLMQNIHPDKGGSTFFAKQLNVARDTLLADVCPCRPWAQTYT